MREDGGKGVGLERQGRTGEGVEGDSGTGGEDGKGTCHDPVGISDINNVVEY